ncbi:MAG: hypothetical protein HY881_01505 [Deltaproteobacteria bacterium]|nr:hypothetical protein [Deltaproteobacteria bacterium]
MSTEKDKKLAMFKGKRIRKILHEGEWWFVVGGLCSLSSNRETRSNISAHEAA